MAVWNLKYGFAEYRRQDFARRFFELSCYSIRSVKEVLFFKFFFFEVLEGYLKDINNHATGAVYDRVCQYKLCCVW